MPRPRLHHAHPIWLRPWGRSLGAIGARPPSMASPSGAGQLWATPLHGSHQNMTTPSGRGRGRAGARCPRRREDGGGRWRLVPLPGAAARPAVPLHLPRVPGGVREPGARALRTRVSGCRGAVRGLGRRRLGPLSLGRERGPGPGPRFGCLSPPLSVPRRCGRARGDPLCNSVGAAGPRGKETKTRQR